MKVAFGKALTRLLTSPGLCDSKRFLRSLNRRLQNGPALVHYFHQADDPYAHLMLQVLPALLANYRVELRIHLVSVPADAAAPDRERLQSWSRRDAETLAGHLGLRYGAPQQQPAAALTELANQALAALTVAPASADSLAQALAIGDALWRADGAALARFPVASRAKTAAALQAGTALRKKHGHYLGATLFFEGEWYWGVDRLYHLEERLRAAGLAHTGAAGWIAPVPKLAYAPRPAGGHQPVLHFYLSLRSPYTYLARPRAVLHRAIATGKGPAFAEFFLRGVWADGIDAGSNRGLRKIASKPQRTNVG